MRSRFNLFPDDNDSIFEHADTVEIKLIQIRNELAIEFKITGGYFPDLDDDDDDSALATAEQPDPADLARKLLAQFVAAKAKRGAK